MLVISSILFYDYNTMHCIDALFFFNLNLEVSVEGFHIIAINYRMPIDFRDFKCKEKLL